LPWKSRTGAVTEHFREAFEARRGRGMRTDVETANWNSLYRLGVNTRILSRADRIHTGLTVPT